MAYRYTSDVPEYRYNMERDRVNDLEKRLRWWKKSRDEYKATLTRTEKALAVAVDELRCVAQCAGRLDVKEAAEDALADIKQIMGEEE